MVQLGYKRLDDWYNVTKEDFLKNGGYGALSFHNGSAYSALQIVHPEHEWLPWKFKHFDCWSDVQNRKTFFDWLGNHLGYTALDDWYKITAEVICDFGGRSLLNIYYGGSPSKALQS